MTEEGDSKKAPTPRLEVGGPLPSSPYGLLASFLNWFLIPFKIISLKVLILKYSGTYRLMLCRAIYSLYTKFCAFLTLYIFHTLQYLYLELPVSMCLVSDTVVWQSVSLCITSAPWHEPLSSRTRGRIKNCQQCIEAAWIGSGTWHSKIGNQSQEPAWACLSWKWLMEGLWLFTCWLWHEQM